MNQADDNIRNRLGRAGGEEGFEGGEGHAFTLTQSAHIARFFAFFVPEGPVVGAQVIEVVGEEFFQTGAGDVGQLDFHFLGGARRLAAFNDVLLTRTRRLNHLVVGPVPLAQESSTETDRGVINDFRLLIGKELGVAAVLWYETLAHSRRPAMVVLWCTPRMMLETRGGFPVFCGTRGTCGTGETAE